ncbi:PAS domain-containing sensor histidine kinase [Spirosoma pomorum]
MKTQLTKQAYPFLGEGGEMGQLIREYNWTATSIGEPDAWSPSLRTLVAMMLRSRFPMLIFWGEELITFYNDAFRPSLGNNGKHPSSLGQRGEESWAESWTVIGPMIHAIMGGGEAVWFEDQKLPIYREGQMSYAYWTYSFSPLIDDTGAIGGVLVTCSETTKAVENKQRLEDSQHFTNSLFYHSPIANALFVGQDMTIQMANEAMLSVWGRDESAIGKPFLSVLPELSSTVQMQRLLNVLQTGETFTKTEERFDLIRYGMPYVGYYNYIYKALRTSEDEIIGVVCVAYEVTEQVVIRQQILDSQQQLLSWFEQAPVGIALVEGPQFIYRLANPFYCALVDRTADELANQPMLKIIPELAGQGFDQLLDQVLVTGQPYVAKELAVILTRHQQTETIYVDLTYQPSQDANQQVTGVLIIATDVTQQVRSRKAIAVREARLRSLVDSAPFPIGVYVGERMYIQLANRSIMDVWGKGYDVIGQSYQDILPELANQPIFAQVEGVRRTGIPFHARHQQVDIVVDGRLQAFYFNYSFTPLLDDDGQVYGVMNTAAEVTDLVVAQRGVAESEARYRALAEKLEHQVAIRTQELAKANQELATSNADYAAVNKELESTNQLLVRSNDNLQQFAYVASHDLQEPLRKIQQFGDLLKTHLTDLVEDDKLIYLERMQSAASRMSTLIRDLLSFSRIAIHQEKNTSVSLNQVLNEVMTTLELVIVETGAKVEIDNLPTVAGDAVQLGQLFQNLLSNALKFRQEHVAPFIRISARSIRASELPPSVNPTRATASYYRVEVADNGIGFDEKYLDRIFQVFQRLHSRSQYAGTGIGLAICEKVVLNHGGAMTATSRPNQGATFSIYLPA